MKSASSGSEVQIEVRPPPSEVEVEPRSEEQEVQPQEPEPRPSLEERRVRAQHLLLKARTQGEEAWREAADQILPQDFEIAKTRADSLYAETQGPNRPFFIARLLRFTPEGEQQTVMLDLVECYQTTLAALEDEFKQSGAT